MTLILSWLTSKLAGPIFGAATVILGLWLVFANGHIAGLKLQIADMKASQAAANAEAISASAAIQQSIDGVNTTFAIASVKANALIEQRAAFIEKEIPHYVTKEVDARYPIPNGVVWMHDAAIRDIAPSEVAAETGGAFDTPSAITASDFSKNDTSNIAICHKYKTRADQLGAYSDSLIKTWNDFRAQYSAQPKE